jgi:uncharacterized protein YrrD
VTDAPPVSWKAIERDAVVVSSDGEEVGHVSEITGDPQADIFNGLVVSLGTLGKPRYLPAERVRGIWPQRVEVDATADEIRALAAYEEPVAERVVAREGLLTRLRRLLGGR